MSRASSYRSAADDLRRAGAQFTSVAIAHRRIDASTFGAVGAVATIHDRSVDTVGTHLASAADEAAQLALECDRRADVCEEYDRRVAAWSALPWHERVLIPRPFPPARWVTG